MKRLCAIVLIFSILGTSVPVRADGPPEGAAEALQKLKEFQDIAHLITNLGGWSLLTIGGFWAAFSAWRAVNHVFFNVVPHNTYGRIQERNGFRVAQKAKEIAEKEPRYRRRLDELGRAYQNQVLELQQHRSKAPRGLPGYDFIKDPRIHSDRLALLLTPDMRRQIAKFGQNNEGRDWLVQFERLRRYEQGVFDAMSENVKVMMEMKREIATHANAYVRAGHFPGPDYFGSDPFIYTFAKATGEQDGILIFNRNGDDGRITNAHATLGSKLGGEIQAEVLKLEDKANRFHDCQRSARLLGYYKVAAWTLFGAGGYGVHYLGSSMISGDNGNKPPQQIVDEGKKKDAADKILTTSEMTTLEADKKKLKDLRLAGDSELNAAYRALRGQFIKHAPTIKTDVEEKKPAEAVAIKFGDRLNKFISNKPEDIDLAYDDLDPALAEAYRLTFDAQVVNPEKLKHVLFSREKDDEKKRELLVKNAYMLLMGKHLWPLLAKDLSSFPVNEITKIKLAKDAIAELDATNPANQPPIKVGGDKPKDPNDKTIGMDPKNPNVGGLVPGGMAGGNPALLSVPNNRP